MPYTLDELKQLRKQAQTVEKLLREENATKKKATSERTRQWGGATGGVGSSAGRDIHRVSSTAPKTNPYTYTGSTGTTSKTGLGIAPRTSPYTPSPYTPSTNRAATAGTYATSTGTAPKVNTYVPSTGAAAYTAASGTGYGYGGAGCGTVSSGRSAGGAGYGTGVQGTGIVGTVGTVGTARTTGLGSMTSAAARTVQPVDRAPSKVNGGNGAPSWSSAGASGVSGLAGTSGAASMPGASGATSRTVRPMDRAPSKVIGGNDMPSWASASAPGALGLASAPGLASTSGVSGATSRTVRPMDRAPGKVLDGGNMPSWDHVGATDTGAATTTAATTTPARKTASTASALYPPFGQAQNGVSAATAAAPVDESGMNHVQRAIEVAMLKQARQGKKYDQLFESGVEDPSEEDEQEGKQQKKGIKRYLHYLENSPIYGIMGAEHGDAEYSIKLLNMSEAELREAASKLDDLRLWVEREERSPEWMQGMHAVYKNDPDSWDVITGKMSQEEWVERRQMEQKRQKIQEAQRQEKKKEKQEKIAFMRKELEKMYPYGGFTVDEDGNLMRDLSGSREMDRRRIARMPVEISVKHVSASDNPEDIHKIYRAPGQHRMVPSFSKNEVSIYDKVTFPPTIAGGKKDANGEYVAYAAQDLDLTPEQQEEIQEMCEIAGMDPRLTLAIIAHESSSKPDSGNGLAYGYMQVNKNYFRAFCKHGGENGEMGQYYEKYPVIRQLYQYGEDHGANMDDINDPLANIVYGIGTYYVHLRDTSSEENSEGNIEEALWLYAGEEEDFHPRAKEILYYRDLLALADHKPTWYMWEPGYYNLNGEPEESDD